MKRKKPTQRELHTRAILASDRTALRFTAKVIRVVGYTLPLIWLFLFSFAARREGAEIQVFLGILAVPVLCLLALGHYAPRFVEWLTKDYP